MLSDYNNRKQGESIFLLTLAVYCIILFVNQTELAFVLTTSEQYILKIARYVCYALFAVKIIKTNCYSKTYVVWWLCLMAMILLCAICSSHKQILILAIVCTASYGCDYRKVIKCITIVFSVCFLLTITFCYIGIFSNQIISADRQRYNLGFNWVTLPSIYFLFITLGYINCRKESITIIELIILEGINWWLFYKTDTRLSFLLVTCLTTFIFIEKYLFVNRWPLVSSLGKKLCILPSLICIGTYFVQSRYTPEVPFWDSLNKLLSGRMKLAYDAFNSIPVTLFGQNINWRGYSLSAGLFSGASYNNVDCSYFRLFFDYGIVGLLIIIMIYSLGIYKAAEVKDHYLVLSYIVVLVFSIVEQWLIELSFNPFILVAVASISLGEAIVPYCNDSHTIEKSSYISC